MRRDDEYVGKRVRKVQMGRWKRARPKRRCEDCVKEDMREREDSMKVNPRAEASERGKSAPVTPIDWD